MKPSVMWKLLGISMLTVAFAMIVVWLSIDFLAAKYFVSLMKQYNISPVSSHHMFVDSVHRYLIWAAFAAISLAVLLSFLLTKRVLGPLTQMAATTQRIAEGDYSSRIPIKSRDEVGQLAEAFNGMAESLKSVEDLRKNLMINVAHELRTPLTNIQGYLEGLLDEVVPASKENFQLLHEETMRLADLVENILRLAKADAARGDLRITEISVDEMITQAIEAFRTQLESKKITVDQCLGDEEIVVRVDPAKLSQVITNLIQNAVQYSDPGGTLRISAERTDKSIRVIFANSGGDLAEQDLPFLFERFYRGEKSRSRDHGGAGLGLAIVKELIEAHNGRVGVELCEGKTRVWFSLPT